MPLAYGPNYLPSRGHRQKPGCAEEDSMINFMVLGGPRSGTTWAANWLNTDTTVCLHDPLLEYSTAHLHRMSFPGGKRFGISCTASTLYPEWVNMQRCPKVVLHRDIKEINLSLRNLGLVELIPSRHEARLAAINNAMHVPYEYLFTSVGASMIAKHLGVPFDPVRHDILMQMRIEPMWKHLNVGRQAAVDLINRIKEAR